MRMVAGGQRHVEVDPQLRESQRIPCLTNCGPPTPHGKRKERGAGAPDEFISGKGEHIEDWERLCVEEHQPAFDDRHLQAGPGGVSMP